jgi:hypothetical protein
MTRYQLAQYNIAWLRALLDSPQLADFIANLDRVNQLAEHSPGFVWRYQTENGNSTSVRLRDDDRLIINFSVWENVESLFEYAFHSGHAEMFRRRNEWFTHEESPYAVLWWVSAGHRPTVEEAEDHIQFLAEHGPTQHAFTFKQRFAPPAETA